MMPHTRRQPNGYSRRAPSNLYFRDARQGCRRLVPQGSAKEAYDRVVAMPERHFLEWGEELPDNVAHPGYQAQTPWPNNPTFGPSGAGRPSDAVARAGVNGPVPTGALAKALDGASAVLSAGAGKGGKPSAGVVDAVTWSRPRPVDAEYSLSRWTVSALEAHSASAKASSSASPAPAAFFSATALDTSAKAGGKGDASEFFSAVS